MLTGNRVHQAGNAWRDVKPLLLTLYVIERSRLRLCDVRGHPKV